jgi:hypothetical protein
MRSIRWTGVSARGALQALAWLAADARRETLLLAEPSTTAGLLGRFQHRGVSGLEPELRGVCGGRCARLGPETLAIAVGTRDPLVLLRERGPLSTAQLLNRFVRGLLAGLRSAGFSASYSGRDFVAANSGRIAQLALTRESSDVFVFQAILAVDAPFSTAERDAVFPGLPPVPPASSLAAERGAAVDRESLAAAFERGWADRFALQLEREPFTHDEQAALAVTPLPPLDEPELALLARADVATPIGVVSAHVALGADETLARVRLRGDWMAAPGDVAALETALEGRAPRDALAQVSQWLARPGVLALGVPDPRLVAGAIAEAASRAGISTRDPA